MSDQPSPSQPYGYVPQPAAQEPAPAQSYGISPQQIPASRAARPTAQGYPAPAAGTGGCGVPGAAGGLGGGLAAGPGAAGQGGAAPAGATQPASAPIPLTQERVVFRATSSLSAALIPGITLVFGLACLVGLVEDIVKGAPVWEIIVLAVCALLFVPLPISVLASSVVLDGSGIHRRSGLGRTRSIPWPASRTGLYVRVVLANGKAKAVANSAQARAVGPDGRDMELLGLTWTGPWIPELERKGVAECSRIWAWAVARGYTRETGQYVPLADPNPLRQALRADQESRFHLR